MNFFVRLRGGYKVGDTIQCLNCHGDGWVFGHTYGPQAETFPLLCKACEGTGQQRLRADEAPFIENAEEIARRFLDGANAKNTPLP